VAGVLILLAIVGGADCDSHARTGRYSPNSISWVHPLPFTEEIQPNCTAGSQFQDHGSAVYHRCSEMLRKFGPIVKKQRTPSSGGSSISRRSTHVILVNSGHGIQIRPE